MNIKNIPLEELFIFVACFASFFLYFVHFIDWKKLTVGNCITALIFSLPPISTVFITFYAAFAVAFLVEKFIGWANTITIWNIKK